MYNYNHLFYFYVTAKSGGVTNAAKHLRLSQPSLSTQLKILEQSLDIKLFNKVGRKNELTDSGATIYGLCRKMFECSDQMNELLSKQMPSASRRLQIGISKEVDRSFVVEVVSLFLKKQCQKQPPQITLVSGSLEELEDRLRFKELDLLVTELAVVDSKLNKVAYAEIPVVLACSSNIDISLINNIDIQSIAQNKKIYWVMPSNKLKLKSEIDSFFEESDIQSQVSLVTDSISSLVRAVKDEIGFALIPLNYITQEICEKSIKIVGTTSGHWKYRVWLVSQQQNKNDELIISLAKSFNEVCHV